MKTYPQNDLQVAIMYFLEQGNHIALVVDKNEYVPLIKREIIHILGQPSWNEGSLIRYSEQEVIIKLVSKASKDWMNGIRGIREDLVYYVEGWNVDDVRHSPYCACEVPDEASGYYMNTAGMMVEDSICDSCGKRISSAEGKAEVVGLSDYLDWSKVRRD